MFWRRRSSPPPPPHVPICHDQTRAAAPPPLGNTFVAETLANLSGGAKVVGRNGATPQGGSLGGFSMPDVGVTWTDVIPGGRLNPKPTQAQAATRTPLGILNGAPTQGLPPPPTRDAPPSSNNGRTIQNWQQPFRVIPTTPILEVVANRVIRSMESLRYYMTDGVTGPSIDILSEFPLNAGFEATPVYTSDTFPPWFDPAWVDQDSLVDADGKSQVSVLVSQWLKAKCDQFIDDVNLVYHMIDLQKEAYIHGDGFANRVDAVVEPNYASDITRIYPENTIADLQVLNPTAIWVTRDEHGVVQGIVGQRPYGGQSYPLDLDRAIHLKHKGAGYTTYGTPVTMRALKDLRVKEAYLDAAQAWGERFAVPIRMLQYGVLVRGTNGEGGPIATAQMADEAEAAIRGYDPMTGQTIVAPFHWKYTFVGAESSTAMAISHEVLEANRRAMAALGIPSAFLMGDWTNYATARIQYSGLMHRLKGVQEILRRILERQIFQPLFLMRGYVDELGQPIRVVVQWRRGHLEDDASYMDLMAKLAGIPGFLSDKTMRESLGFDHEAEEQQLNDEIRGKARRATLTQKLMPAPLPLPGEEGGGDDKDAKPPNKQAEEKAAAALLDQEELRTRAALRRTTRGLEQTVAALAVDIEAADRLLATAATDQLPRLRRLAYNRIGCLRKQEAAYRERQAQQADRLDQVSHARTTTPAFDKRVMVGWWLRPEESLQLAIPGYEVPGDMHVTLAYIGDMGPAGIDGSLGLKVHRAVWEAVAGRSALAGIISGLGRFAGVEGGVRDCIYAVPDVPGLAELRQAIADRLTAAGVVVSRAGANEWTPHITLAYVPLGAPSPCDNPPSVPLLLDRVTVAIGSTREHYTLQTPVGEAVQ